MDDLYTNETTKSLAILRKQIEIAQKSMIKMNYNKITIPLISVFIFCIFWEWLVWINGWPNYKMASPSDLWPAFWKFRWLFLSYGWDTLWRTIVGLSLSVFVGVGFGIIMGFSKTMRIALYPLLVGFNAIPKATVVPVIALMFVGFHDMNTILIVIFISFFPIAVSISIGLSTLEPEYKDILLSLGATKFEIFYKIALPKTLPEFWCSKGSCNFSIYWYKFNGNN